MTNPTSNFGWQMPTSTDLVTDLPADFEVFGQAVDTTLADLKGGTTGQVLKKNSNTDMDFVWSADSAGMTNPMTTTGDTIYSSSGSTPARLGIGTAGQYLKVNAGATAPEWATLSAGGWTQLATGSLSSTVTQITSISGSYKELVLYILKPLFTNTNGTLYLRFNNDSNTRYSSDSGSQNYGDTFRYNAFYCTSDLSNVSSDGMYRMEIPHYANTTTWKIAKVYGGTTSKTGTGNDIQMGTVDGFYNQTGAITEVDIVSTAGNFTGGTYILYGVN